MKITPLLKKVQNCIAKLLLEHNADIETYNRKLQQIGYNHEKKQNDAHEIYMLVIHLKLCQTSMMELYCEKKMFEELNLESF